MHGCNKLWRGLALLALLVAVAGCGKDPDEYPAGSLLCLTAFPGRSHTDINPAPPPSRAYRVDRNDGYSLTLTPFIGGEPRPPIDVWWHTLDDFATVRPVAERDSECSES